jgi:hypothetical protein
MIKENQRILNSLLVVIDVLVILFSLVLAYYVRFKTTLFGPLGGSLPFIDYFLFTVFAIIPTYLLLYYFFGLYKPFRNKPSILSGAEDIIKADIMAFIILSTVSLVTTICEVSVERYDFLSIVCSMTSSSEFK